MEIIAKISSPFETKFGVPRQSGLAKDIISKIVFETPYRDVNMVRGLESFSHIWLIWCFSEAQGWHPTVRPPRLGGEERVGVFASRSPFRPNPIGLSSVKLEKIEYSSAFGPLLYVSGADLKDGTPIYDIKPYLPYADCHTEASGGFTDEREKKTLEVAFEPKVIDAFPQDLLKGLVEALALDPRPAYQEDPERIYGMSYAGFNVRFKVSLSLLTVVSIDKTH